MPKTEPPAETTREPCVHRKNVLGFRTACEQTWGKGAYEQAVAQLPPAVRERTAGLMPLEEWIPETFLIAWTEAVWRGPAQQDPLVMRKYVCAAIGLGFGRVRRFFLQMMTPETITARAVELWREEHTTGTFRVDVVRDGLARVQLSDHPYVESPLMRLAFAEALRFIVSLTRADNVTERHASRGSPLVIHIGWTARG